jgi:hypothetical protein
MHICICALEEGMSHNSNAKQLPFDFQISALEEASHFLDDSRQGYFALCTKKIGGNFSQRMMPLHTLPFVLEQQTKSFEKYGQQNGKTDTWISQATFNGWPGRDGNIISFRRKSTLASIATLFCDIDYYKNESLKELDAHRMSNVVLERCLKLGYPLPSIIINTGKGLQLKWYHEALPRAALVRWEACSSHLVNSFIDVGCDTQVRDATRILRVLHTINQKNGQLTTVVWANPDQECYTFNDLCKSILPYSQEQIKEFRIAAQKRKLDVVKESAVTHFANTTGFSLRTLNWARFNDLQTLHKFRNHDMGDSLREPLAFLMTNQYALCHQQHYADPTQYHEILRVVKDTHNKIDHNVAIEKARRFHKLMKDAQTGKIKIYKGKEYSPLYTPSNEHFINLFGISSDEQKHLSTIIDSNEKNQRKAKREEVERKAKGSVSRKEYENNSISSSKPWEKLGMSRATWYRKQKSHE